MLPAVEFTNTDLWQSIQRMVSLAFPSDGELLLADVVLHVLRWGDQLKPDLGDINDVRISIVHGLWNNISLALVVIVEPQF